MNRAARCGRVVLGCVLLAVAVLSPAAVAASGRPNVVLIVCDDLNDYVNGLHGHPQARTPNLERLAESGVSFTRAYSNNPICAPSRASFLSGIYPHTSRHHFFAKWNHNPVLKNARTLPDYFRANGYHVAGTGKVFHDGSPEEWTEYAHKPDYGPFWYKDGQRVAHPGVPEPYATIGPVDGSFGALEDAPPPARRAAGEGWVYGVWGSPPQYLRDAPGEVVDPTPDERNAAWAAAKIEEFARTELDKPFFLGVGFIRPHTPLHVPRRYFDLFPADTVELPVLKENDAADTGLAGVVRPDAKGLLLFRLLRESYGGTLEGLRAFTRAYLASVAAVDACIGQVVDAVDRSPFRDNTIIVVTSDHGWNMGQKDWLFKNALWEASCRVPLVIRAPGVVTQAGRRAGHPVSLIDLYPTLADLCGLTGDTRKNDKGAKPEGHSLRPFLEDPENGTWTGPDAALSMVYAGPDYDRIPEMQHYSLRNREFRYIRYNNGSEELYDHRADPREWENLASRPEHAQTRDQLRRKLDAMTGLSIGVIPPRQKSALERGERQVFTFDDFDVEYDTRVTPPTTRAAITREPAPAIAGGPSLLLSNPGSPWNTVIFLTVEVPPGMSCRIAFDCRALKTVDGGFFYYLLAKGMTKSRLIKVPLAAGEQQSVQGTLLNDQDEVLNLVLGFSQGGTYVIDNVDVSEEPGE